MELYCSVGDGISLKTTLKSLQTEQYKSGSWLCFEFRIIRRRDHSSGYWMSDFHKCGAHPKRRKISILYQAFGICIVSHYQVLGMYWSCFGCRSVGNSSHKIENVID